MELRKGYIGNEALETIYFGGGTPSQLDEKDFGKIFYARYLSGLLFFVRLTVCLNLTAIRLRYNGVNKGKRPCEGEQISKITSQFGL